MFFTGKDSNFDSYSHLTHSSLPKDPDGDERKLGRCLKANLGWLRDPFLSFYPAEGLSDYSAPYSVRFSHSDLSDSLQPHGVQHARLPCPSPTPGACLTCPSSWWCHPTISSSVVPFSSCLQSFPASGSSPLSQFFTSGGQRFGVSASASALPMNIQEWCPLGLTSWISLQSKGLSRVFCNITVQKHQFFCTQLSLQSNSHIHTWPLEKLYPCPLNH